MALDTHDVSRLHGTDPAVERLVDVGSRLVVGLLHAGNVVEVVVEHVVRGLVRLLVRRVDEQVLRQVDIVEACQTSLVEQRREEV